MEDIVTDFFLRRYEKRANKDILYYKFFEEEAKEYVEKIINVPVIRFIEYIESLSEREIINAKDIVQFSDFDDATINLRRNFLINVTRFIDEIGENNMGYYNSCRDELLEVVKDVISRKGKNEFTVLKIVNAMEENGTTYKESTIRTHITSKCCVNAPENHYTRFSDYQRIEHGLYKME